VHQGALFTTDWLKEGITATPQWQALDDARIAELWTQSRHLLDDLLKRKNPTEADTEQKLIYPLLGLLGWDHISVQQNLTKHGRKDVPDALLFPDAAADATASGLEPWQRFRHGAALVEAKRWGRPLDRQGAGDQGVPSTQIMHYLQRASVVTEGRMPWGILTNGRHWRLYYQNALSVAEDFFEIDLGKVFDLPGCTPELFDAGITAEHAFRLFVLAFGRDAFLPTEQGRSFHLIALEETKRWEERVRKDLAETVFSDVFPKLIAAIPSPIPIARLRLMQPMPRKSVHLRCSCSTGCCSSSMPKTATCCPTRAGLMRRSASHGYVRKSSSMTMTVASRRSAA
jgi:hypothetical protein